MNASVRELKNRLSEYLRRVRAGERIVVTDRGRPVAELLPLSSRRTSSEQRFARLVELGEATAPLGRGLADIEPAKLRKRPLISRTLLEDRG
jgi:prevent-host-death family protein